MSFWSIEEKDCSFVSKKSQQAAKVYFLVNLFTGIILTIVWLTMVLDAFIMLLFRQYFRALLMAIIDILVVYLVIIARKNYKRKISCKYIKNSIVPGEYTLLLSPECITINNISYSKADISAVFLLSNYAVFVLNDKSSFIVQLAECKDDLYNWLHNGINVYTWSNDFESKQLAKNTRMRLVKKLKPVLILILASGVLLHITGIKNNTDTADGVQPDSVESFTFDMNADINSQLNKVYEFYSSTLDFEETGNIYYSYVSQAANVLAKTHYKNGDMRKNKELLVLNGENSCYINYYKPENSDYFCFEIVKPDKTVTIQKGDDKNTVTTVENKYKYNEKDMYRLITEYDYICSEYPIQNYKDAYFALGTVNLRFENSKIFTKECVKYRMGKEDILFSTESKDKEFEIKLKNIPQTDVNNFLLLVDSVCEENSIPTVAFSNLVKEFNKIITY